MIEIIKVDLRCRKRSAERLERSKEHSFGLSHNEATFNTFYVYLVDPGATFFTVSGHQL